METHYDCFDIEKQPSNKYKYVLCGVDINFERKNLKRINSYATIDSLAEGILNHRKLHNNIFIYPHSANGGCSIGIEPKGRSIDVKCNSYVSNNKPTRAEMQKLARKLKKLLAGETDSLSLERKGLSRLVHALGF